MADPSANERWQLFDFPNGPQDFDDRDMTLRKLSPMLFEFFVQALNLDGPFSIFDTICTLPTDALPMLFQVLTSSSCFQ